MILQIRVLSTGWKVLGWLVQLYRNRSVKPAASVSSGADILWWRAADDQVSLIADAEQVSQTELKGDGGGEAANWHSDNEHKN